MVAPRDALRRPSAGSTSASSSGASSYFDRYPERKGQGEYVPDQKLAMPRFKTLYRDGSSVLSSGGGGGGGGNTSSGPSSSSATSISVPLVVKTTSKRSTKDADAVNRAVAAASRPAVFASKSSSSSSLSPVSPARSYSRYAPPPDAIVVSTSPTAGRSSVSVDDALRSRDAKAPPALVGSAKQHRLSSSPIEHKLRSSAEGGYTPRASSLSSSSTSLASSTSFTGTRSGRAIPTSDSTSSLSPSVHYDTLRDSMMTGSKSRTRERLEKQHAGRMAELAGGATASVASTSSTSSASRGVAASRPPTSPLAVRSVSQRSLPSSASSSSIAFVTSSSASTSYESFAASSLAGESGAGVSMYSGMPMGSAASSPSSSSSSSSPSSLAPALSETRIPSIDEIIARNSVSVLNRPVLPTLQSAPQIGPSRGISGLGALAQTYESGPSARATPRYVEPDITERPTSRLWQGRRPSATTPSLPSSTSTSAAVPPPVPPKAKDTGKDAGRDAVPSIDDIIKSFAGSLTPVRPSSIVSKTPTPTSGVAPSTPRLVLPESSSSSSIRGQGWSVDEWGRTGAPSLSSRRPSASEAGWSSSHARTTSTDSESDAASMASMDSVEKEVYASLRKARISESAPPDEHEGDVGAYDEGGDDDDASYFASASVYSAGTGGKQDRYGHTVEVLTSPKRSSTSGPRSPAGSKLQSFVSLPKRRQSNSSLFSNRSQHAPSSAMSRGHSSPGGSNDRKATTTLSSSRHAPRSRTYSGASSIREGSVASTLHLDTTAAAAAAASAATSSTRKPLSPLSASGHRGPAGPASPVGNANEAALARYLRSPRLTQLITLLRPPYTGSVVSLADVGDPKGHPVVVFLGLGAVRYLIGLYDDMAKAMGLRLICVDRWGMGKTSDMPSARRGIRPWAFVVVEVLDRLGVTRCSLLAHSAGAPYAMALALALRQAADNRAQPPPIEVAGPILLLAPWVSSSVDNGYKWLRYVPDSVIKTAQAAEWKMQGWKLGKPQSSSIDAGAGAGRGSGPATPLHSYDAATSSPPGSASLGSPQSGSFSGGSGTQDAPALASSSAKLGSARKKPNLLGPLFASSSNGAGAASSSGSSRLSPSPGPSTPGLGRPGAGLSSSHLPHHPRRAVSSNGEGEDGGEDDDVRLRSRSSVQLWRSSSSVDIASSYAIAAPASSANGARSANAGNSCDSDLSRGEGDGLGDLRKGSPSMAPGVSGGGGGRERRSARIASWIASDSAMAMLDGRLDASRVLEAGASSPSPSPSPSACATPVVASQAHASPRADDGAAAAAAAAAAAGIAEGASQEQDDEASLDLATALLRASHSESLKGGSADLLTILGRSSQQPWGFTYADVGHPTLVWHGDKDERIGLTGALWMERHLERCELRIVQGAGHGLMTNVDVVVEALETARAYA